MKLGKKILAAGLSGVLVLTCCACGLIAKTPDEQFSAFLREVFVEDVAQDAISLHYTLADPSAYGIRNFPETFGTLQGDAEKSRQRLERLKQFDPERLSMPYGEDYQTYQEYLELSIRQNQESFAYYEELCGEMYGVQSQLPLLLAEYVFRSEKDVEQYLALLKDFGRYFDDIIAYEQEKSNRGLFMSPAAARRVIAICDDFLNSGEENVLLGSFQNRLLGLSGMSQSSKDQAVAENNETVHTVVIPAFERLRAMLDACKDTGRDGGLCELEQGKAYYETIVAAKTGSSRSVEELLGLVDRRLAETILTLLTQDVADAQEPPEESRTPQELLLALETLSKAEYPALSKAPSVQVKQVPDSLKAASAPAFYIVPPMDMESENYIYINGKAEGAGVPMLSTLSHEGYPGHMYQSNFYNSTKPSPLRGILDFQGYIEGWAQYVEHDFYRYAADSEGAAAMLKANMMLTLLAAARVDIAIHYLGSSSDDIVDFYRNFGMDEESARDIYNMLQATPGYYLPYIIGALEFSELRGQAEEALGDAFSPIEFHRAVLTCGPAPFSVVTKAVDRYIASRTQADQDVQEQAA